MRKIFGQFVMAIVLIAVLFPSVFGHQSLIDWVMADAIVIAAGYILKQEEQAGAFIDNKLKDVQDAIDSQMKKYLK